jgi:hypothetical protein
MSENNNQPSYNFDFEFITQALGLIPINGGETAIAPGAITDMTREDTGYWTITLGNASAYTLDPEEMVEFEQTIKERAEAQKLIQKEAMRNQAKMQMEVMAEMQASVQPGMIIGGAPGGKRFHQ